MVKLTNKFGTGDMYTADNIKGKIYIECSACMSIYSETLSWCNANKSRITKNIEEATSVVVLSCQVTDLAVLNDMRTIEKMMLFHPKKDYYIGGCLSRRFDIPLPAMRLDHLKKDYTILEDMSLVHFQKPFWVKDFRDGKGEGNLFRNFYPLRIGTGCEKKCKYCSIRVTRGEPTKLMPSRLAEELLFCKAGNKDIVLIADSPSVQQIKGWCDVSWTAKYPISIRNLEPSVAMVAFGELISLSNHGLLKNLHVPVQSTNRDVIKHMNRDVTDTMNYINYLSLLDRTKTKIETNIIVDYLDFPNPTLDDMKIFDSFVWNPYWDGVWNRENAEKRFEYYITDCKFTMK